MRLLTFLRALHACSDITFVPRTPPDLGEDELQNFKRLCSEYVPIPVGSFGWSRPLYKLFGTEKRYLKVLPLIFSGKPIFLHANILANNRSGVLDSYLKTVRWSDFDVLHVNRLFMADSIMDSLEYVKKQGVYTVLDLDDIESHAVERALRSSLPPRTAVGRTLRRLDLRRLRRYEKRTVPLFDACVVCSDSDREEVLKKGLSINPWVIPNAVDTRYFQPDIANASENQDILFVGNMNFSPNVDAVRYFAERIFPAVLRQIPTARFIVAGQKPVDSVSGLANGDTIIVTGKVADPREYYNRSAIAVAPIRFGGGTRVKILEAMAMGKAVVTTPIGVEGIPATDREEMIIASDENDFAAGCVQLLGDRALRAEMGRKAREFVSKYFDASLIEDRIRNYYLSAAKTR